MQAGVNANDMKWDSGNQNQTWVNTNRLTTVAMCVWPARDCNEIVTFRPPIVKRRSQLGKEMNNTHAQNERKKNRKIIWVTSEVRVKLVTAYASVEYSWRNGSEGYAICFDDTILTTAEDQ